MSESSRLRWVGPVLMLGAVYFAVGVVTSHFAAAATNQLRVALRLSAWALSAGALAAHVVYDHVQLGSTRRATAMHAAFGVALGAFGLAIAASVHGQTVHQHFPYAALAAWPVATALPAFVVALVLVSLVARARSRV